MEIYIQRNGQIEGPLSQSQYCERFEMGALKDDDLVSTDQKSWSPVSRFVDSAPAAQGRWRHQYNCRKCGTPYKTLTLGRLKATDVCGECNARHNRIITACFAVLLIAAFVAEKMLDREHEDQIKTANAYVSSLSNPRPHATPDDNVFLFPTATPSGRLEQLRHRAEPIVFPTIPPLPSPSTTPAREAAVLRSSESDFKARYGEPDTVMHEGPVETDTFVYEVGDWIVRVGFWKELAQHIAVAKADRTPMTESDADAALSRFAEHEQWSKVKGEIGKHITGWDSGDATALLEIYHYKANDGGESQSTLLRIMTDEFYREYNKSTLSK